MSDTWLQIVTGAPKELDDDGTLPLSDDFGVMFGFANRMGRTMRLVAAQGTEAARSQIRHYASNGYFVMRKSDFEEELKAYPDFYKLNEDAEYYYRESIDFSQAVNWGSEKAVNHLCLAIGRVCTYPAVNMESSDGGLTYLLTVKGSKEHFEVIRAELRAAYREGELLANWKDI